MPLICEVKLSKESGITVVVINEADGITQTIHMDGTQILTKVEGKRETSTITQREDSIAIKCKTYTVDAETITCTSTKQTKHESKDTFLATSANNMTLETRKNLTEKAVANVTVEGMKIKTTSKTDTTVSAGTQATVDAKIKATVSATMVEVAAKAQATVSGAMVQVDAKGLLNAQASGLTNVKGALTTVQGALVKLG